VSLSTDSKPNVHLILTHPGGAHKDEFLACCVLVYRHEAPISRREPRPADLEDPATLVVDVGGEHTPERGNFDHHQFPRDHEPLCALSLVLADMRIYEEARKFCDWLQPAEWFDCRGPRDTAQFLGVEPEVIGKMVTPIDLSLLRRFAMSRELGADDPLWQIMRMVGEDLVCYIEGLSRRLAFVAEHAQWWTVDGEHGSFEVLFMPRTDPMPNEPSAGLPRYIEQEGRAESVVAMVYPDRRGDGYALARFHDNPLLDCAQLTELEDVHFAHARGFVAKTSATDPERLKDLLRLAQVTRAQA